jgi:hypothetical protein
MYIYLPRGRRTRVLDDATETFVNQTRQNADPAT